MRFRFTRRLIVNVFEGTILVILIVAACYVSIGRILIANIEKFHSDIEKSLSASLNTEVHIGSLSGSWIYLDPMISVQNLVIGDAARPAVKIGHLAVRVDSIASLIQLGVVVRNIDLDGLALSVVRDDDGGWGIEGMPRRKGKPFNPDPLLDSIPYLRGVDIRGVQVEVSARQGEYHIANQADKPLELVEEGAEKTIEMPLSISRAGEQGASEFELLGRYSGDPRQLAGFSANLYLRLPQVEIADFLPAAVGKLAVTHAGLRGQLWLDCANGQFEIRGLPVIDRLDIARDGSQIAILKDFSAALAATTWGPGEWQVHFADVATRFADSPWKIRGMDLAFHKTPLGWEWGAHLPTLDIAEASRVASSIGRAGGFLTDDDVDVMKAIAPGGRLTDIVARVAMRQGRPDVILSAKLEDAHIDGYRGFPAVSAINGFAVLSPDHGYVDLHNDRFKLDFSSMFPEAWNLDSAKGRIYYDYSPGYVRLTSSVVSVTSGSLKADARVHLNLPADPDKRTWGLEIGMRDADLRDTHKYLPATVSDDVRTWLNRAITRGRAVEAGLLFHGTLGRDMPKISKVYDMYFKVEDATLAYDPAWPPIDNLKATIYIGDSGVYSDGATGTIYASNLTDGHVSLQVPEEAPADSILIDAKVHGPLADGIKVLTETPVAEATNHLAKGWIGSGDMTGSLKLDIPIGPREGQPTGVDVSFRLPGDNILMSNYDLDVLNIDGSFRYRNDAGLSSPAFSAVLFKQKVEGKIATDTHKNGGAVEVNLSGKIDVAELYDWSRQVILTKASGLSAYTARLQIPFGDRSSEPGYVEARSNLAGVKIDLPAPMGKNARAAMPLVYRQSFLQPGYKVDLVLGALTKASFKMVDGIVRGGRLNFGKGPLGVVTYDKLKVTGNLDFVDYGEWQQVADYLDQKSKVPLESTVATTLDSIDVDIDRMKAFGLTLDKVHSRITRDEAAWKVDLKNALLSGSIAVPDDDAAALGVSLDYLRFVSDKDGAEVQSDPLAGLEPTSFVPIDFTTKELDLDGEDYGSWAFQFRPSPNGGSFNKLKASVKGLEIGRGVA